MAGAARYSDVVADGLHRPTQAERPWIPWATPAGEQPRERLEAAAEPRGIAVSTDKVRALSTLILLPNLIRADRGTDAAVIDLQESSGLSAEVPSETFQDQLAPLGSHRSSSSFSSDASRLLLAADFALESNDSLDSEA